MIVWNLEKIRSAVARRARLRARKLRARFSRARRPVILMYHRIADETFDPWGLAVAPDKFAQQLSWLANHRSLLSLSEFARLHRIAQLPDDAIAVTFDDGYACTARIAAPLLNCCRVPATIFLPAGLIGRTRSFWWDELAEIVMKHGRTSLSALGRTFNLGERHDRDGAWPRDSRKRTPRQNGFYALWAALQPLPPDAIEEALAGLRDQDTSESADERHRLMTPEEVRSIRSERIEFGSHALSHTSLPGLPRAEKAREIRGSVAACEELAGTHPLTFAYPFGDFDAECEAIAADAGFRCACTVEPRAVSPDDRLFALPRLKAGNWTWRQLRQALADASWQAGSVAVEA